MYCKNCGSYMEKGQFVCIKCGGHGERDSQEGCFDKAL